MARDYLAAVARWLADQPRRQVALGDLAVVVDQGKPDRKRELEKVRGVVELLDALGFVAFHHHVVMPAVGVLHRDGLWRVAAGEPLGLVADDVERARPLTTVRSDTGWMAFYLPPHRIPANDACDRAGRGATANDAVVDLQRKTRTHLT